MTASTRALLPRTVIFFSLLLFAWTHRHALGMSGFADDLGLLVDLSRRAQQGSLLTDVLAHVTQPLWVGSTMWRPLPYASFALDAALWGADAGSWRITNLALHLVCASVAGLLCRDLTKQAHAGAVGFAVFLLIPWSPEVVIWLVGRFDGWATLCVLVSLWAALTSHGFDRWAGLSLFAGAVAYASKENAMILPVWIAVIVVYSAQRQGSGDDSLKEVLRRAIKSSGFLVLAHSFLALVYLLWRAKLFSASSLNVYAAGPQLGLAQLATQIWAHAQFPLGLSSLAPIASWIVGVCFVSVVAIGWRSRQRVILAIGMLFLTSVVAAVAIYFAAAPGEGDGYRLYYLATIGFALIVASASTSASRIALVAIVALLGAMAFWQSRVTDEWQRASLEIKGSEAAMRGAAMTMPPQDYGLVLLPDHLGHVPLARNAQGALPNLAGLPPPVVDVLGRLVVFTPPQIDEWHGLAQEGVVQKITSRADAPPNPTQYFCFDSRSQTLQALGFWPAGTVDEWRRNWRESVAAACPHEAKTDG